MPQFTIKKLIDLPRLKKLRLVRGQPRMDNVISNVNIIDNPDSYEWFTAGDFLLTTGYIFKDKPALQVQLIKELSDLNCSGLGIKIKRYWETIPKTILDEAAKRNFPIVEIPYQYSLAQVSNIINDEIFGRESSELKKFKDIYDAFAKVTLEGGSLLEIAKISSQMIRNSVIVIDAKGHLLAVSEIEGEKQPLKSAINLKTNEAVFLSSITETLPKDAALVPLSLKRTISVNDTVITLRFMPSIYSNTLYGYIIAWETNQKLQKIDYIALETAARTLAVERIKTRQLEESRFRQKSDLFDDLIGGKFVTSQLSLSVAEIYGINTGKTHISFVINTHEVAQETLKEILELIDEISLKNRRNIHATIRGGNVLGLVELWQSEQEITPSDSLKRLFENIHNQINHRYPEITFSVGVSNAEKNFSKLGKQLSSTFELLKHPSRFLNDNGVIYYHDFSSYHLLTQTFDQEKLIEFFHDHLGKLYEYDQLNKTNLMQTLIAFYESNTHVENTAKRLFLHRNTIIYRLEKIKEILPVVFDKETPNFNLQLALKIYQVLQLELTKTK
jgi:PucR family transcriptional regulator, purine catabolism regulatory protein